MVNKSSVILSELIALTESRKLQWEKTNVISSADMQQYDVEYRNHYLNVGIPWGSDGADFVITNALGATILAISEDQDHLVRRLMNSVLHQIEHRQEEEVKKSKSDWQAENRKSMERVEKLLGI